MKILIITQNDYFSIPSNIKLLCESNLFQVSSVVVLNSNGNIFNKKIHFIRGFGFFQSTKNVFSDILKKT